MRAQVSVFIIIGVLLMVSAGIVFWVTSPKSSVKLKSYDSAAPVRAYVEQCIASTAAAGLELAARQGGYIYCSQGGDSSDPVTEGEAFNDGDYKVAYILDERPIELVVHRQDKERLAERLKAYLSMRLNPRSRPANADICPGYTPPANSKVVCDVAAKMKAIGYDVEIERQSFDIVTLLNDKEMFVQLLANVTVHDGASEYLFSDFSWSSNSPFMASYDEAAKVAQTILDNCQGTDWSGPRHKKSGQGEITIKPGKKGEKILAVSGVTKNLYLFALDNPALDPGLPDSSYLKFASKKQYTGEVICTS
ncbi:hypothetical protein HYY74_06695 [Candidatus Woesearchaeota archaeon]|nr:hypothetical protein [Candidatus Woesearchaeota archaeon]